MPLNKLKKYPELLEILHLSPADRNVSLKGIFNRDIEENTTFAFREKRIYPIKSDGEADMDRQFMHLTCEETIEEDENGNKYPKRMFDKDRSMRLHWILHHIEERQPDKIEVFSVEERDVKKRKDVIKTYIYDEDEKYIIVLEPQRVGTSYYLLSAYYLNRDYGVKEIKKKLKKKLSEIY
ncbi:hypothetical protein SAMD00024442_127_2 [Candidatus Symbiothrix dinenymphae]|nr:hypothetical protein SAMD00024442_127_2 [Candidatus Symbiothrix dinenymphae]